MHSRIAITAFSIFTLLLSHKINAQNITNGNTNTWFLFLGTAKFSEKWSVASEFHERTGDFLADQGQILLRPWVNYSINDQLTVSVGYTFINVQPYEPYEILGERNEHNIWQQLSFDNEVGAVDFNHRLRQENRWVDNLVSENGEVEKTGTNYANRLRYRLTASVDIFKLNEGESALFANVFDEIWINQNESLMFTSLARNWLYLGLGYRFNSSANIQLAYMFQSDKAGPDAFINSPIVQLSFFKTLLL